MRARSFAHSTGRAVWPNAKTAAHEETKHTKRCYELWDGVPFKMKEGRCCWYSVPDTLAVGTVPMRQQVLSELAN